MDRVLPSEGRGRAFESRWMYHRKPCNSNDCKAFKLYTICDKTSFCLNFVLDFVKNAILHMLIIKLIATKRYKKTHLFGRCVNAINMGRHLFLLDKWNPKFQLSMFSFMDVSARIVSNNREVILGRHYNKQYMAYIIDNA